MKQYSALRAFMISISVILFSGCAMGRLSHPYEISLPCAWHAPLKEDMSEAAVADFSWWENLGDVNLCKLIAMTPSRSQALYAEIGKTYIELRGFQAQRELLEKNRKSLHLSGSLTKGLVEAGFINILDQWKLEELEQQLVAEESHINLSIDRSIFHLATLLEAPYDELFCELSEFQALLFPPLTVPVGTPSELICQLKKRQTFCEYRKTVLQLLEEAESAIAAYHYELEYYRGMDVALFSSHAIYEQTLELYQRGLKSYPEVLETQRSYYSAKERLLKSHIQLLYDYITLYQALKLGEL